jgi:hypothetical protein
MKRLLYFLFGILIVLFASCNCNESKVPSNVRATFAEMFPDATDIKWEMEDEGEWEVEFKNRGKEISACFTDAGVWIETEWEIEKAEITESVLKVINSTYEGWEIDEVEFVESPEFNGYEIELEMGEEEMEVLVTSDGVIIITEQEDEDIEED